MPPAVIILVLVVVVVALIGLFLRKKKPELPEAPAAKPLPSPAGEKPKTTTKSTAAPVRTEPVSAKPAEPVARPESPKPEAPKQDPAGAPAVEVPAAAPAPEPVPVVAEELAVAKPPVVEAPAAKRDLTALTRGLQQTRVGWVQRLVGLFGNKKAIDPELLQQLQETLIMGDVGPRTTERVSRVLEERLAKCDVSDPSVVWGALRTVSHEIIDVRAEPFGAGAAGKTPLVILVVGVNGVGKTTTIGKLAARYKEQGKKVVLAAGDTFRAAAVAQLEAWGKRVGVPVIKGKDLSKPSAVVFDAVAAGVRDGADVVIADTAGRLHTKTPLMDELRKLKDAAAKAHPGAPHEVLLVLDATTGQNGIVQVKEFREALELTGIVLTKLDGTAKGGVILAICDEFKLPVRFVGVGEKVDDLRDFEASDFTDALFAHGDNDEHASA